jgi:uncharacterized protein (TIGR02145 family)
MVQFILRFLTKRDKKMKKALLMAALAAAVVGVALGGGKQAVSTFTDKRDGQVYRIVQIGRQVWFAENLNYAAKGSKCYENSPDSCAKYGRLYNWKKANNACPSGWRLPNDDDWITLENTVGGHIVVWEKLNSSEGWKYSNGTDDYGFTALPGGSWDNRGDFFGVGVYGGWWSATERGANYSWLSDGYVSFGGLVVYRETNLFSVRCVADKEAQK